jgi:hypothetical protein
MQKGCLRVLLNALLVALVGGMITAGLGRYAGWATPRHYSDGLFIAGGILAAFGVLGMLGGQGVRANIGMLYSESAGDKSLAELTRRWVAGISEDYGTVLLLLIAGGILVGVGVLIDVLGG